MRVLRTRGSGETGLSRRGSSLMALLFTWRAASLMPSWLPLAPLGPLSSRGQPPGSPRTGSDAPDPWGRSNSACSVSPWHPRRQRGPLGTMRGPARAEGRPLSANRQTESPGRNGWCIFCGPRTLHRKIKRRRATFNGFLKTPRCFRVAFRARRRGSFCADPSANWLAP
jgi:hypothetical protein